MRAAVAVALALALLAACDDPVDPPGGGAGGSGGAAGSGGSGGAGGGGAGPGGSGGAGGTGSGGAGGELAGTPYFPPGSWFERDVSGMPLRAGSTRITAFMERTTRDVTGTGPNGWGTDTSEMRVDFSLVVVEAPAKAQRYAYDLAHAFYFPPDCDLTPVPLPEGGTVERWPPAPSLEGLAGYECPGFDDGDDCHLLVFAPSERRLYELYHFTRRAGGQLEGGCLAIWPTDRPVAEAGRGQHCTSADAAGFPIAPLLVRPEEVAAGEVRHALRFVLPNPMIRERRMVPPATHAAGSGDDPDGVPYGALFRLRADYPLENLAPPARVVARAMQKYGMYLADGGNVALTFAADTLSSTRWEDLGVGPRSFAALKATDFHVVDTGTEIFDTWECQRTPIVE